MDTRQRIVDSALELFLEEGAPALSMRRVADRAGVGTMTTYRHFENKDALLTVIALHGFTVFEEHFYAALSAPTPSLRLWACGEQYLAFALAHPRLHEAMFVLDTPVDPTRERMARAQVFLAERLLELDAPPADAGAVSLMLFTLCHGMVSLHLAGRYDPRLDFPEFYRRSLRRTLVGLALLPPDFAPDTQRGSP